MNYLKTLVAVLLLVVNAEAQTNRNVDVLVGKVCEVRNSYTISYEEGSDEYESIDISVKEVEAQGGIYPMFGSSIAETHTITGFFFDVTSDTIALDSMAVYPTEKYVKSFIDKFGFRNEVWENGHTKDAIIISYSTSTNRIMAVRTKPREGGDGVLCTCVKLLK